jgi:3-methyladenine DNA glycosylase AlkD
MKKVRRLTAFAAKNALRKYARPAAAKVAGGYFKTGKGQYGEGDKFIGVKVPDTRKVALQFREMEISECKTLLRSKIHEERLLALIILVDKFRRADDLLQKTIYQFYLQNLAYINNWDLVDTSAPQIVGAYLYEQNRSILYKLARSNNLWKKRVAILATLYFIREDDFMDTLKISEILMKDEHDLIHKAVGWMLREVGNQDATVEHRFLRRYQKLMPRTMLRYAIEKFSPKQRKLYLEGRAK